MRQKSAAELELERDVRRYTYDDENANYGLDTIEDLGMWLCVCVCGWMDGCEPNNSLVRH